MKELVDLRKEKKLTQEQVAETVGIGQSYYSKIENGNKVPKAKVIKRLAEVLGEEVIEILVSKTY